MSATLTLGTTPLGWPESYGDEAQPRMGFFTDTSICIGCKACEIACKEWNQVPQDDVLFSGESFDNTGTLSANSWRHVAFIEQPIAARAATADGPPAAELPEELRWLMSSDVCKHCTHAACLDVCPTGAIFRTEFGTVVIQQDVCNGCGYCVPACPFGVITRRERDQLPAAAGDGEVAGLGTTHKCTLCYDRLKDGMEPACAKACPTDSIQFGELDELRQRARGRVEELREEGVVAARLYGEDPSDGVGGFGAFFLLLDDPEVYGLPPDPVVPTRRLPEIWGAAVLAGAALVAGVAAAVTGGRR